VPKPDRRELDRDVQILQAAADEQQARIEALKRKIEAKRETKKSISQGAAGPRARIAELNAEFNARMEERKAIREELNAIDAARDKAREQTTTTRAKLGKFHTVDAVESEIARVERTLGHTTMPIQEEKKMVNAIKDLTKSKELVREYQEMAAKVNAGEERRKLASERVKAKDAEITAVKAAIATVKSSLEETRSREEKSVSDVPAMQEERNACYEIIKAKREEIRKLRASFKKKEDQHWASEKIWRAYAKYEKQKQYEASAEERKARDEARKKWERENAPEPFEAEVTAAEQLIAYLAKWDPMGRDAEDDAARAAAAAAAAAEATATVPSTQASLEESEAAEEAAVAANEETEEKLREMKKRAAELLESKTDEPISEKAADAATLTRDAVNAFYADGPGADGVTMSEADVVNTAPADAAAAAAAAEKKKDDGPRESSFLEKLFAVIAVPFKILFALIMWLPSKLFRSSSD